MKTNSDVESYVRYRLEKLELYPFSVVSTLAFGSPLVSVTLYSKLDLDELLDRLEYKYKCDKTGFTLIPESNTIMFTKSALVTLLDKL